MLECRCSSRYGSLYSNPVCQLRNMSPIFPSLWMLPRSNQARDSGLSYNSRRHASRVHSMTNNTAPALSHEAGGVRPTRIPDLEAGPTINNNYLSVPPLSYNARPSTSAQPIDQRDTHTSDNSLHSNARWQPRRRTRRQRFAEWYSGHKLLCKVIFYAFLFAWACYLIIFGAIRFAASRRESRHDH